MGPLFIYQHKYLNAIYRKNRVFKSLIQNIIFQQKRNFVEVLVDSNKYLEQAELLIRAGYVSGWNAYDLAEKLEKKADSKRVKHSQHGNVEFSGVVFTTNPDIIPVADEPKPKEEDF